MSQAEVVAVAADCLDYTVAYTEVPVVEYMEGMVAGYMVEAYTVAGYTGVLAYMEAHMAVLVHIPCLNNRLSMGNSHSLMRYIPFLDNHMVR